MPRMDNPNQENQLAKLLLIGDAKSGKTDLAGMAGADGFNVLYLDGDVASQTIADLPVEARRNVYLLKNGDKFSNTGGIDPTYTFFFKDFCKNSQIIWNDSKNRTYGGAMDKESDLENDEFWIIRPGRLDENTILVIEWTSLVNSCMQWAANEAGVDLGEVDERKEMRGIYQAAGEKLTQYALFIQRMPCHVIALTHPREFVKMTPPAGKTVGETKEKDMKVAWTKMVPISSSNNHAMSIGKYFTDIAWMESGMLGKRYIDFRIDANKIIGGHFNERFELQSRDLGDKLGFRFADLVKKVGGIIPGTAPDPSTWLTIQTGYTPPVNPAQRALAPKSSTVSAPAVKPGSLSSLAGLANRVPG